MKSTLQLLYFNKTDLSWVSEMLQTGKYKDSSWNHVTTHWSFPPGRCWFLTLLPVVGPGTHLTALIDKLKRNVQSLPMTHWKIPWGHILLLGLFRPECGKGTPREGVRMAFAKGIWLSPMAFLFSMLLPECLLNEMLSKISISLRLGTLVESPPNTGVNSTHSINKYWWEGTFLPV